MDNKEAINWLTRIRDRLMTTSSKQFEAMTIAIAALEFKERYDNFWEEVKTAGMKGKETEIHHGGRVFRIREVYPSQTKFVESCKAEEEPNG